MHTSTIYKQIQTYNTIQIYKTIYLYITPYINKEYYAQQYKYLQTQINISINLQTNKPIYINIILYFYFIILLIFSSPLLFFHTSLTILHLKYLQRFYYQYISKNFPLVYFFISTCFSIDKQSCKETYTLITKYICI